MKKHLLVLAILIVSTSLFAQKPVLRGVVTDAGSKEALVGASVVVKGTTTGAVTDLDGNYQLTLSKGSYELVFSYVGYATVEQTVELEADTKLDAQLASSIALKEVVVTADIAIDRKTPVAFSNIGSVKLAEELASQDLPMILNSTPGAYATQQGGGDGDARINIRGFSQRNVAVLLDGIPVNDMENGQVFWSNWFGLGLVTKTMQVQRGLGSSKISIPSVGGTINILTKGIDTKSGFKIKQDVGEGGFYQTTVGFTTGKLDGGWGMTGAFSSKKNDGFVDLNYSKALFYFLRIDKEIGKHLISIQGFGGPQEHGQRAFSNPIALTDSKLASELGVSSKDINSVSSAKGGVDRGLNYSDSWGIVNGEAQNIRINYYNKPQFSLRHSWAISGKTFLSNVAYLSIGNGGGTSLEQSTRIDTLTGQLRLQEVYNANGGQFVSTANVIRAAVNNHFWYGFLSTLRHEVNKSLNVSAGIDLRYYKGEHYRTIYDMFGGRKFLGSRNERTGNTIPLSPGDKYYYNYDGFVRWGGGFGMLEYSKKKFSAFVNVSGAQSQYRAEDYLYAKTIDINGKKYYTSYATKAAELTTLVPNVGGTLYTVEHPGKLTTDYAASNNLKIDSTSAQNQVVDWVKIPSITFKTGFSYNFNPLNSFFMNVGYISKAQRLTNVINTVSAFTSGTGRLTTFNNYQNELIKAVELGYQYRSRFFAVNVNAYYTDWQNKPVDNAPSVPDPNNPQERIVTSINGISARHTGIETDFNWSISKQWRLEGVMSLADWVWNSKGTQILPNGTTYEFDPTGVHVGDAAQTQVSGSLRYQFKRGSYISARSTYFGRNYANFNPEDLKGLNARRESWQAPDYILTDLNFGYVVKKKGEPTINLRASILNLFNKTYIADARNNDTAGNVTGSVNFDATSATVFFGLARHWVVSMEVDF
jgi:iron complex outermembrane recepter protein